MDLLSISRTVRRHKLATLPVIILMFIGITYTLLLKAPVYHATSSYILISPPVPASPNQIASNPALANVNSDNPYVRFGDLGVMVEVLTQSLGTDQERASLLKEGVNPLYTIGPDISLTTTAPIMDVTGVGSTPSEAIRSAILVGRAITTKLGQMQGAQHVGQYYWITSLQLTVPDHAQLQVSSKLRMLVAVLAFGVIILFLEVSTLNALAERRYAAYDEADYFDSEAPRDDEAGGGFGQDPATAGIAEGADLSPPGVPPDLNLSGLDEPDSSGSVNGVGHRPMAVHGE
jgi:hypothetical protein